MSIDKVANVRFNAAQSLQRLAKRMPEQVDNDIGPQLKWLIGDEDADVQFFAAEALQSLGESIA